jgi:hypothetical protein
MGNYIFITNTDLVSFNKYNNLGFPYNIEDDPIGETLKMLKIIDKFLDEFYPNKLVLLGFDPNLSNKYSEESMLLGQKLREQKEETKEIIKEEIKETEEERNRKLFSMKDKLENLFMKFGEKNDLEKIREEIENYRKNPGHFGSPISDILAVIPEFIYLKTSDKNLYDNFYNNVGERKYTGKTDIEDITNESDAIYKYFSKKYGNEKILKGFFDEQWRDIRDKFSKTDLGKEIFKKDKPEEQLLTRLPSETQLPIELPKSQWATKHTIQLVLVIIYCVVIIVSVVLIYTWIACMIAMIIYLAYQYKHYGVKAQTPGRTALFILGSPFTFFFLKYL